MLAVHRDATFTEADAASAAVAPEQDSRMAVGDPSAPAFAAAARMEHQSEANALRQNRGQVVLQAALLPEGGVIRWFGCLDLEPDILPRMGLYRDGTIQHYLCALRAPRD